MAEKPPQTDPFLAAIEAKIAAWTTVRDSYIAALSLDTPLLEPGAIVSGVGTPSGTSLARAHDQALPVGVFRDKGLKEAIPIYLTAMRRKQTNKEIAAGLQAGGFPTTAENFEATVATALYRLKSDGVLLRFPDGWDLASSYPDNLRNRLEKDGPTRKPKARKRLTRKPVASTAAPATKKSMIREVIQVANAERKAAG